MAVARPRTVRKKPLDIALVVRRIRTRVKAVADAAMFELKDAGHGSLFEQLVACIISIRTLDEVSLPAAKRLFAAAPTPDAIAHLGASRIDRLIGDASFHAAKARWIHAMAVRTRDELGGTVPCDAGVVMSFTGIGPKCANLALGIACGQSRISVDVHVHRVTNRWGYVRTATPEQTMAALERKLPKHYWVEINRLLVPFGKHVCTGRLPRCSECPVADMCRQVGVTAHR